MKELVNTTRANDVVWTPARLRKLSYRISEYEYEDGRNYITDSLSDVVEASVMEKEPIRKILAKHPNWNPEKDMIIVPLVREREGDYWEVDRFYWWMKNTILDGEWPEYAIEMASYFCQVGIMHTRVNDYDVKRIYEILPKDIVDKVHPVEGQKKTKVVRKFADVIGLSDHPEWSKRFPRYCDAITPVKLPVTCCISINFEDFIFASTDTAGWTSCYTIAKTDYDSNGYHGAYSAGTTSYALDRCTIQVYCVSNSYNGMDYEKQPKIHRCNFCVDPSGEVILQNRVYPDGRDSTSFPKITEQIRELFLQVWSECMGIPNDWEVDQGMYPEFESYDFVGYPDFAKYSDTYLCYNSNWNNSDYRSVRISIGATPKCICCGEEYYDREAIMCEDCREKYITRCERCGAVCEENDSLWYDGDQYCCIDCARRDRLILVAGGFLEPESDCFEYDGGYYSIWDPEVIHTEDGMYLPNEEAALDEGYVQNADGEWVFPEEVEEV